MAFKKGQSGNIHGRPRGAMNKANKDLVQRVTALIDENFDLLNEDLRNLEPKERVKAIIGLMGYVIPKRQAITAEQAAEAEYKKLSQLLNNAPENVIDELFDRINILHNGSSAEN